MLFTKRDVLNLTAGGRPSQNGGTKHRNSAKAQSNRPASSSMRKSISGSRIPPPASLAPPDGPNRTRSTCPRPFSYYEALGSHGRGPASIGS